MAALASEAGIASRLSSPAARGSAARVGFARLGFARCGHDILLFDVVLDHGWRKRYG
jgi:hypothetical protein